MTITRLLGTLGVAVLLATASASAALAGGMHLNEANDHDSEAGAQAARAQVMRHHQMMHHRTMRRGM